MYISIPSLLFVHLWWHKLHLNTLYAHQYRFIIMALCMCLLNEIGKRITYKHVAYFIFTYRITSISYHSSSFLFYKSSCKFEYCQVSFHFSLKDQLKCFWEGSYHSHCGQQQPWSLRMLRPSSANGIAWELGCCTPTGTETDTQYLTKCPCTT